MNYYVIDPPPDLALYVRSFWVLEYTVAVNDQYVYRAMADGCAEMIFHYNGVFDEVFGNGRIERSFRSGLHGASTQYRRFRTDRSFGIFGVYLYPFAIPALFGIPASELSDSMPDTGTVLGVAGKELEEKIMLAGDNQQRVQIIVSFLRQKLRKQCPDDQPIAAAIKTILARKGQVNVNALASEYCLSTRQFERRFKELSGFSPKLYSRIIRFQSVFHEFKAERSDLAAIASDCGYYDQSHFIHDFKTFSGFNPKEFFSGRIVDATGWTV
jgi:AraC-like DNA-binding protein